MSKLSIFFILLTLCFLSSCSNSPEPIRYGSDNCHYCKMTITDKHFGAEMVTNKGKVFKFDEISCMLAFTSENELDSSKIKGMYISDYCGKNLLLEKNNAFFLLSDSLKSPMGGNIATFSNKDSLKIYNNKISGKELSWAEVLKYSNEE